MKGQQLRLAVCYRPNNTYETLLNAYYAFTVVEIIAYLFYFCSPLYYRTLLVRSFR